MSRSRRPGDMVLKERAAYICGLALSGAQVRAIREGEARPAAARLASWRGGLVVEELLGGQRVGLLLRLREISEILALVKGGCSWRFERPERVGGRYKCLLRLLARERRGPSREPRQRREGLVEDP